MISAAPKLLQTEFQVYVVSIHSIKRYIMLDLVGGLAFFLMGRILLNSDLLCIACNIIASQMLHYIVGAA
ncbi:hypothetical protein [Paenibacillus sp. FSL W7-1287]|uniref:hypothetical protein n=1 Tax=Paenibacillus sp. FSL W7-1287 TaxID=2954538 RepID=UPI0030F58B14